MDIARLYHGCGKKFDVKYPAIKSQIKLSRIFTAKVLIRETDLTRR